MARLGCIMHVTCMYNVLLGCIMYVELTYNACMHENIYIMRGLRNFFVSAMGRCAPTVMWHSCEPNMNTREALAMDYGSAISWPVCGFPSASSKLIFPSRKGTASKECLTRCRFLREVTWVLTKREAPASHHLNTKIKHPIPPCKESVKRESNNSLTYSTRGATPNHSSSVLPPRVERAQLQRHLHKHVSFGTTGLQDLG